MNRKPCYTTLTGKDERDVLSGRPFAQVWPESLVALLLGEGRHHNISVAGRERGRERERKEGA